MLGYGGVELRFTQPGDQSEPGSHLEFIVDEFGDQSAVHAYRRGGNVWGAVGVIVLEVVRLVLAKAVKAALEVVLPEVLVDCDLGPLVVGVLIDSRDDRGIVRSVVVVGAVVVVERRHREQGVWIEGVNPGERDIAIRLALGIMYLVAERHLRIRQRLDRGGIAGTRLVAGGDRPDHVAIALAHVVRAVIIELLGALGQGRRSLALVGEGGEHQPIDALGRDHGIGPGTQRSGGLAEEMEFLPTGLARDDFDRGLEVLHAAGDIGISGGAARLAVILVIHGPAVETVTGELVHDGIFAVARHFDVERPRGDRGAVHEEEYRPRGLAGLRRPQPLAIDP